MKPKEQVINQSYLSISDIRSLLNVPFPVAKSIFQKCKDNEVAKLGQYRPYENKVQLQTVLRVTGIRLSVLQSQIKSGN